MWVVGEGSSMKLQVLMLVAAYLIVATVVLLGTALAEESFIAAGIAVEAIGLGLWSAGISFCEANTGDLRTSTLRIELHSRCVHRPGSTGGAGTGADQHWLGPLAQCGAHDAHISMRAWDRQECVSHLRIRLARRRWRTRALCRHSRQPGPPSPARSCRRTAAAGSRRPRRV